MWVYFLLAHETKRENNSYYTLSQQLVNSPLLTNTNTHKHITANNFVDWRSDVLYGVCLVLV